MKTIATLSLLVCTLTVQAQIKYDYEARMYVSYDSASHTYKRTSSPCLKHGEDVSYWLTNINPFAQDVVINGSVYNLATPMSAQLATLFNIKAEADKKLDNTDEQVREMADTKRALNGAPQARTLDKTLDTLVSDCNDYYLAAHEIKEAFNVEEQLIQTTSDKHLSSAVKMKAALAAKRIDSAKLDCLEADFEAFEDAYEKVRNQYTKAVREARNLGNTDKEARIRSAQSQVQKDYEALEAKYQTALNDIRSLFNKAIDSTRYMVKSPPLKLAGPAGDADEVAYEVKIDKGGYTDVIPVKGGLKVDFSVGPVANFIADEQFFFATDNVLQRQTPAGLFGTLTPSVASMMHLYERTSRDWAVGVMFGINAGFKELTDLKLGFLSGASLILGRSQKVMISTGVSYLPISRLREGQYVVGQPYPAVKLEDVTERVLRPAWFAAFSFNISKRSVIKP